MPAPTEEIQCGKAIETPMNILVAIMFKAGVTRTITGTVPQNMRGRIQQLREFTRDTNGITGSAGQIVIKIHIHKGLIATRA